VHFFLKSVFFKTQVFCLNAGILLDSSTKPWSGVGMSPSRGIWISSQILSDPKLRHIDKLILSYVQGFSGDDGCFASNRAIAELLGVQHPNSVQNRISFLVEKKYLRKVGSHNYRKLHIGEKVK